MSVVVERFSVMTSASSSFLILANAESVPASASEAPSFSFNQLIRSNAPPYSNAVELLGASEFFTAAIASQGYYLSSRWP